MLKTNYHKTIIMTLVWLLAAQAGLVAQTKDLPRLAQDDMRVCGNALNAVGRANPLVGSCKYVWVRTDGNPFAQGEISDRNSHNPLISTNVTSSYGVTAYDITGAVMATDQIRLDVISYSAVMHFPAVMAGNTTTPFSVSPTRGQTFENLDNDDNDNLFDNQDNDVSGNGDDELIRLEITAEFQNISITETNPLAAGSVRFWADPNRTTLVGINSDITMTAIANSVPLMYRIVLWVEGVSAHDSPDKYGFQIKNAAGADCGLPMTITVLGVSGITLGGNNNGYVTTTNTEPTSNTLDAGPYSAGVPDLLSYRVFADARYAAPTVAMDVVNVSVSLSVAPIYSVTVYLRTFDIDDPSPANEHVDPNDDCPADINIPCSGPYPGTAPSYNGQGIRYDAGNDNRTHLAGQFKFGNLRDADANGIATIIFPALQAQTTTQMTVSHHPGDNYRLAANADVDFVNRLLNRDAAHGHRIFNRDANLELLDPAKNASHVLTVWRVLNVEGESMPAFVRQDLKNQNKNKIIGFVSPTNSFRNVASVEVLEDIREFDMYNIDAQGMNSYQKIKDLSADYGSGRFEGGTFKVSTTNSTILSNTRNEFILNGTHDLIGNGIGVRFIGNASIIGTGVLVDLISNGNSYSYTVTNINYNPNFSFNDLIGCRMSIAGGSPIILANPVMGNGANLTFTSPLFGQIGCVAYDDDTSVLPRNLTASDIQVYFDGSYLFPIVIPVGASGPFIEQFAIGYNGAALNSTDYWNSDNLENDNNWYVYVLMGWQGTSGAEADVTATIDRTCTDNDPDDEYGGARSYGITFGPLANNDNQCSEGLDNSIFFIETIRDSHQPSPFALLPERTLENIVVHEIGHQLGLTHCLNGLGRPLFNEGNNIGIMSSGGDADVLNQADRNKFIPRHLNQIRSRVSSPGHGF